MNRKQFKDFSGRIGQELGQALEDKTEKFLDDHKIKWTRPTEAFAYILRDGSVHHFHPDFWLTDLKTFLECKRTRNTDHAQDRKFRAVRRKGYQVIPVYNDDTESILLRRINAAAFLAKPPEGA